MDTECYQRSRVRVSVVLMLALVGDGVQPRRSLRPCGAIPNWDLVRSLSLFLFHPLLLSLLLFPSPLSLSLSSSLPSQGITGASDKDSPKELKLRPCPSLLSCAPCHSASLPENSKKPTQSRTRTCKPTSSAQINFLVTSSKMRTNGIYRLPELGTFKPGYVSSFETSVVPTTVSYCTIDY